MRRSRFFSLRVVTVVLASLVALLAVPASGSDIREVRVGLHPTFARVVVEFDRPATYVIGRTEARLSGGQRVEIAVEAGGDPLHLVGPGRWIDGVSMVGGSLRSRIAVDLAPSVQPLRSFTLTHPDRLILDVAPRVAERAAPPPVEPAGSRHPRLVDVRVGDHTTFVRVVFEFDREADFRLERTGGTGGTGDLRVKLNARSPASWRLPGAGAVQWIRVDGVGDAALAVIELRRPDATLLEYQTLQSPPRLVVDLRIGETPRPEDRPAITAEEVATQLPRRSGAAELVGRRVKLRGVMGSERIVATRIKVRAPGGGSSDARVAGGVQDLDSGTRSFSIGPLRISWNEETRFGAYAPEQLSDLVVEVRGELLAPGHLRADSIEAPPGGLDDLEFVGRVTDAAPGSGTVELATLHGIEIEIPSSVLARTLSEMRSQAFDETDRPQRSAREQARDLSRELDKKRPADQMTLEFLGRPLTIGGELDWELRWRNDFTLGREANADDELRLEVGGELELLYEVSPNATVFLKGSALRADDLWVEDSLEQDSDHEWSVRRGQTWIYIDELFGRPLGLQLGRIGFKEERAWWWDANIDSIRLFFHGDPLRFDVSIGRELFTNELTDDFINPRQEDVLRVLVHGRTEWLKRHHLDFFTLAQLDTSPQPTLGTTLAEEREDPSDADLTWFGLRASGKQRIDEIHRIRYWVDLAGVFGRETVFEFEDDSDDFADDFGRPLAAGVVGVVERFDRRVSGWGLDAGVTWEMGWPCSPRFTLGYALGSGDNGAKDGHDHSFRQTGLHNNNGKFLGVDRFRYYGELLRPELSNLHIVTTSVGFPLLEESAIEIVYHYYRQAAAASSLRSARLKTGPSGLHPDIGHELDLVLGLEEWRRLELELVVAFFWAGRAYDDVGSKRLQLGGQRATLGTFKVKYNF